MIHPQEGAPAQVFTLRNSSGKDIRFEGWKLAEVSSQRDVQGTPAAGAGKRWKERAVYQTKAGKVVCHKLGCSSFDGETDRGEVLVLDPEAPEGRNPSERVRAHFRRQWDQVMTGAQSTQPSPSWADERVKEFFSGDALAKALLEMLGIEDIEVID